jgi:hypothetical protein
MLCTPHQIKKNEIDGACSTYGERRGACGVLVGKPDGKNHLEDLGVDGRIVYTIMVATNARASTVISLYIFNLSQ